MDLARMLEKCRRDQWSADDLDWTLRPRPLSREHEMAIVQYFTDMSGIELLAGALFAVQRDLTDDPTLKEIFASFVVDEERHSDVALRLARHYDVHRYKRYETNPHLRAFAPHFVRAVRYVTPDVANAYITTGELLLDIALLRSLDDFVDDEMSHRAMRLINRDESRHIAIDYYMVGHYASAEYDLWLRNRPREGLRRRLKAQAALAGFMWHARPFFRDVFFAPMDLVDPSGRRLLEAFKRIQLLGQRVGQKRGVLGVIETLVNTFNDPKYGPWTGPVIERVTGLDLRVVKNLYTDEEAERAKKSSYDALAEEALAVKEMN